MNSITTKTIRNRVRVVGVALFSVLLAACGDSTTTATPTPPPPVVQAASGYVVDAAVTDASCTVHVITDGVADPTALATATSDAGAVDFGTVDLTGAALLACTGGTFTDEATGETLGAPDMSAIVGFAPGGSYVISLLTEIATRLAEGQGDLITALTTHNAAVADSFGLDGVDITSQRPTDLNEEPAADNDAGKYGTALLLLAQMVEDASFAATRDEALTVLTDDLADDAQMSAVTVAALEQAATNFAAGNAAAKANMNMDVATGVIKSSGIGARPVADAGLDQSVAAGASVTLTGTGTDEDGSIASYQWEELTNSGVTLSGADSATLTFTSPSLDAASTLEFKLTVTDDQGGVAFDSVSVAVAAKPVPEKSNQDALSAGADQSKRYGDAAFTQAATGGSGSGALSYASSNEGVATISANGEVTIVGVGTATITATKAADAVYNATTDSFVVTVAKADQAALNVGANLSKTYGDAAFTQAASGGSSTGPITYASGDTNVATVTSDGVVTIVGAGSTVITATKAGDSNYNAVTDSYSLTVALAGQEALEAGADVSKTYGDAAFTQAATGGSGTGALSYASSDTSIATVDADGTVTIVAAGSVTITASKAADGNYTAVSDSYTLTIGKAAQAALNAGADADKTYGDAVFTQAATGGSGTGALSYASSNTGVATVDANGAVTVGVPGTATITASKAADGNYTAASDSYSVTVAKAAQAALNAGSDVAKTYGDAAFTQAATGGSGTGALSYASSNTGVATVDANGAVTEVAPGTAIITASKAADSNYTAASDSYSVTVAKAAQAALSAGSDVAKTYGDAVFTQAATGGSGTGALSYASSDTGVATVDANGAVTVVAPGTATITASKAADGNYTAASDSYTVTVAKADQASVSAGSDASKALGDGSYTQAASGGSGTGGLSYASSDTSVATVDSSGVATFVAAGSTTITATKAGDANYNGASDSYILTVTPLTISSVAVTSGGTIVQDDSTTLASNASSVLGSAVAGKSFTITGTGFGSSSGSVAFQSDVSGSPITATVSSWSNTSIVVSSPEVTLNTAGAQEAFKVRVTSAGDNVTTSAAFTYDDCDTCRLNDNCPF